MVLGEGPDRTRFMIVGEAPGRDEVKQGRPFVGMTGKELMSLLSDIGLSRSDCYLTNVVKREIGEDKLKGVSREEMEEFSGILESEIASVQPTHILALGAISTHWFLGDKWDMEVVNAVPHEWRPGITVVPCFHPAAVFRDPGRMAWVRAGVEAYRRAVDGEIGVWTPAPKTEIVEFDEWVRQLPGRIPLLALDTETFRGGGPYMVQASCAPGTATYLYADDSRIAEMAAVVAAADRCVLHNALFDVPVLQSMGITFSTWDDTMQMAFLLQTMPQGLKEVAYKVAGMVMKTYDEVVRGRRDLSEVEEGERLEYACADPDATLRVYHALRGHADRRVYRGMVALMRQDCRIQPMIITMMQRGMPLNVEALEELEIALTLRNMELEEDIDPYVAGVPWPLNTKTKKAEFNPGSPSQVSKLLYDVLGLGKGKRVEKTKTGRLKADSKNVAKIAGEHPVVPVLQEWNTNSTLLDNNIKTLPRLVQADGRIHASLHMNRVVHSGRMASTKPNLLAQPTRSEDGKRIRNSYQMPEGRVFASFDYSQIEMRVLAHESRDEKLIQVFLDDLDLHKMTASWMFGIGVEQVEDMAHRYPAKRVGFGVVYGITATGLARELNATPGAGWWSEERAQEAIDMWFGVYYGVRRFMASVQNEVKRTGKVRDMWGRELLLPEVWSVFQHIREGGLRKAVNQRIQGGAQGVIRAAEERVWQWIQDHARDRVYPLLQIHDDLLFELWEEDVDEMVPVIANMMGSSVELCVPTPVDAKVGVTWGKMRKWKKGEGI